PVVGDEQAAVGGIARERRWERDVVDAPPSERTILRVAVDPSWVGRTPFVEHRKVSPFLNDPEVARGAECHRPRSALEERERAARKRGTRVGPGAERASGRVYD